MPLGDPDEPELPLGGELGTGMLLGLGWVMTVCDRQPVSSSAPRAAVAVKPVWPAPVVMNRLPKLAHRGTLSRRMPHLPQYDGFQHLMVPQGQR